MPFLLPNQQRQSTEGIANDGQRRPYVYDLSIRTCMYAQWKHYLTGLPSTSFTY